MKTNLQTYNNYKPSGVEWLGEIPEHWEVMKLGFLGEFSASGIDKFIKKSESKVKIINFTDVYGNLNKTIDISFNFMEVTTPESNRIKHLVKKGDMIFLPSSETYEDLGLCALVNEDLENTAFSYHVIRFVLKKEINHSFRKYFTNNTFVQNQFSKAGKGTTRKIIGRGIFKNIQVILPPITEQIAIAKFLDDKTAKIDQAITIKKNQIELLKERRQILIHKAVTRGLNDNVKLKDSGVEWIGDIPEGWELKKVKHFGTIKSGETVVNSLLTDSGLYEVFGGNGNMGFYKKFNVQGEKIIIGRVGAYCGNVRLINEKKWISDNALILTLNNSKLYNYLSIVLNIGDLNKLNSSNAQPLITGTKVLNFIIPIPPKEEQTEISNFIATATTKIATAISLKEQEIEKLKEYKASLINSVVTGKVRVN